MSRRYLSLCPLPHAISLIESTFPAPGGTEYIPLSLAEGRIAAEAVYAQYPVPAANIAGMDGIAVQSMDTLGAGDQHPLILTNVKMVDTGNIVPPPYDAVIMIEDVWQEGEGYGIRRAALPGQHIRLAGEDIRPGMIVIPAGHQIRPSDISALTTYGFDQVRVRMVRIGIIPVGNELVPVGVTPKPGQVIESNSICAQSYLSRFGATATRYPIVPDDRELLNEALQKGLMENDLVIISSGTAAGRRDYTADTIRGLGSLLVHGIAMLPGKPAIIGDIGGKPVIGLPGYPVAAQTVLRELVLRLLSCWGFPFPQEICMPVRIARNIPSELGYDEFIPVSIGTVNGSAWAFPHPRGSGIQMALVRANGYIHIGAVAEGKEAGTTMDAHLTVAPHLIDRVLLLTGTHEPAIDILGNFLARRDLFMHFFDAWNIRAISTLISNACTAAAIAIPAINPGWKGSTMSLPDGLDAVTIHIADTEQGILSRDGVKPGDFLHSRIITPKRGSTSRVVLDWFIGQEGYDPSQVTGYTREVRSPDALVQAVRNGSADACICSSSIAVPSGLQFYPLVRESHELYTRAASLDDSRVRVIVEILQSACFREALAGCKGYLKERTGEVREISCSGPAVADSATPW